MINQLTLYRQNIDHVELNFQIDDTYHPGIFKKIDNFIYNQLTNKILNFSWLISKEQWILIEPLTYSKAKRPLALLTGKVFKISSH